MKVIVEAIYTIEVDVNPDHPIVKDYSSMDELLFECASYRFDNTLPVIAEGGVTIIDIEFNDLQHETI